MNGALLRYLTDLRQFGCRSGAIAAGQAADSQVLQFRWPAANAGKLALLDFRMSASPNGTAFTAGRVLCRMSKITGFSASGTGGTLQTLTGNNGKMYASVPAQAVPEIRVATTAALGAGTQTLGEDLADQTSGVDATVNNKFLDVILFNAFQTGIFHPLIFEADEGFAIRMTVPATGVWSYSAQMQWGVLPG